jgi:hypothetical protein
MTMMHRNHVPFTSRGHRPLNPKRSSGAKSPPPPVWATQHAQPSPARPWVWVHFWGARGARCGVRGRGKDPGHVLLASLTAWMTKETPKRQARRGRSTGSAARGTAGPHKTQNAARRHGPGPVAQQLWGGVGGSSRHSFTYIGSPNGPIQRPNPVMYVQYECYETTAGSETRKLARMRPARCPA